MSTSTEPREITPYKLFDGHSDALGVTGDFTPHMQRVEESPAPEPTPAPEPEPAPAETPAEPAGDPDTTNAPPAEPAPAPAPENQSFQGQPATITHAAPTTTETATTKATEASQTTPS